MGLSTGEVLERALVADPDDLAAHSAYADWLSQQGDPRGEFIQVQLLLEDRSRPAGERAELQKRESELLRQHARTWLGDVGRFLVGNWSGVDRPFHFEFAHGWLDMVRLLPAPDAILAALGRAPEARLLRRLEVIYDMRYHPFAFDLEGPNAALTGDEEANEIYEAADIMPPLIASPYLTNLRVFKLGFSDTDERPGHSTMVMPFENCNAQQVIELLTKCPRVEELYLNTTLSGVATLFASPQLRNVRVLQYYYGSDYMGQNSGGTYPVTALANNTSLDRLTTLKLHAGRDTNIDIDEVEALLRSPHLPSLKHLQVRMTVFGDEGCRRIIETGVLRRLKTLDIGYGTMTDASARLLAASPDLKKLDILDVTRNGLTEEGIAALQDTGIRIIADNQHEPDEQDFFYEVDFE